MGSQVPVTDTALSLQNLQLLPLAYYNSPPNTSAEDDFDLAKFMAMVRRRIWIISGVALAVASINCFRTLSQTPIYQAQFDLALGSPNRTPSTGAEQLIAPVQEAQAVQDMSTQLAILQSPTLLKPVYESLASQYPDLTYEEFSSNLRLSNPKSSQILTVTYQGSDPQQIQTILQGVSQAYLAYSLKEQQDSLSQGISFVDKQLPVVRDRVQSKQDELEKFRQAYSLVDPEARGEQLSQILANLQEQQRQTQVSLVEAQSQAAILQQQLGSSPDVAITSAILSEAPHYQEVLGQIKTVQMEIAKESVRFQPNSPQIQTLVDRRQNLEYLLQLEARKVLGNSQGAGLNDHMTSIPLEFAHQLADLSVNVQVLGIRFQALQAVEQQLSQEFSQIPQLATQYENIQRELDIATNSLNRFLETRETLEIESSQKPVPWQLLSEPIEPTVPISPDVPRNILMGLLMGLGVGVGAGLLRDRLDHVVHSLEEIQALTSSPVLAQIPYNSQLELPSLQTPSAFTTLPAPALGQQKDHGIAKGGYKSSPFSEAFRLLYSNLRFLKSDNGLRSLVISSALSGDGKSTVSLYLAQAAAAMGQRVLLVDGDMRCPKLHQRLNLSNLQGLSNVLARQLDPDQVIQMVGMNFSVLTAGTLPPDPTSLLSSNRMQFLIERFEASYDLVIYDTPPLLGLADASLLATGLDGLILTVGLGKTDQAVLKTVINNLKVANTNVLGVVVNGVTKASHYSHKYYNYYHQRENSGEDSSLGFDPPSGESQPMAQPSEGLASKIAEGN